MSDSSKYPLILRFKHTPDERFEIVENVKHKVKPRYETQVIKEFADTNHTDVITQAYNEGWDLKGTYIHAGMLCFFMVREVKTRDD